MKNKYKYIYGPVPSWRLGSSLGIDLLSQDDKICTFDCLYCQLGRFSEYKTKRGVFVSTEKVIDEIKLLPDLKIDYLTFSGRGEPTLALNLGRTIKALREIRKEPVAVLSNSSLIDDENVRKELALADYVSLKLDAYSESSLKEINRPDEKIKFNTILEGIKEFRKEFKGKLALQIMFLKENKDQAVKFIELAKDIKPDEIQVNTPLRPCGVMPLSKEEIEAIKEDFKKLPVELVSVYDKEVKKVSSISRKDTLKRRGKI